jgi:hypothetical protein
MHRKEKTVLNLLMETEWRTAGRWGSLPTLLGLLAGDGTPALPLPRYVLRWLCQACETHFLGTDPAPQSCPRCHRPLGFVAQWDLAQERAPRWWADPGTRGIL